MVPLRCRSGWLTSLVAGVRGRGSGAAGGRPGEPKLVSRLRMHGADRRPRPRWLGLVGVLLACAGSDPAGVSRQPEANLAVRFETIAVVAAGDTVRLTLVVSNWGPDSARQVTLLDSIRTGAVFLSASDGGTSSQGVVTWPVVGALPAGDSLVRQLVLLGPPGPASLLHIARVNAATPDPVGTDNRATATTLISPPPPPPLVASILDTLQWGGGEVRLRSEGFRAGLPVVVVHAETLTVRALDPVTVAVRLPGGPSGVATLEAAVVGPPHPVGTVRIVGPREAHALGPFGGDLRAWMLGGAPSVLGRDPNYAPPPAIGYAFRTYDVRTRGVVTYPALTSEPGTSPGFSVTTGEVVLRDTSGSRYWYTLYPVVTRGALEGAHGAFQTYQVSDSTVIRAGTVITVVQVWADTGMRSFSYQISNPWTLVVAPQARRVVILHNGESGRASILDAGTGLIAGKVSAQRMLGAALSPDESTAYLLGNYLAPAPADSLLMVASNDGTPIGAVSLPDGPYYHWIVADPVQPYLYVLGTVEEVGIRTKVFVFALPSLTLVGTLEGGRAPTPCSVPVPLHWRAAAILDPADRTLHVVLPADADACHEVYDLMP